MLMAIFFFIVVCAIIFGISASSYGLAKSEGSKKIFYRDMLLFLSVTLLTMIFTSRSFYSSLDYLFSQQNRMLTIVLTSVIAFLVVKVVMSSGKIIVESKNKK